MPEIVTPQPHDERRAAWPILEMERTGPASLSQVIADVERDELQSRVSGTVLELPSRIPDTERVERAPLAVAEPFSIR